MPEREPSDAQAIIDTAQAAAEPALINPERLYSVVVPAGDSLRILDLEEHLSHPQRARGTVHAATVSALIDYVTAHADESATTLWVHPTSGRIVAVLDDHAGDQPGWGEHRAQLDLTRTPEWKHWQRIDGTLIDQEQFAEHIQDGLREIVEPAAADMLEIAQSIQAKTQATFKSARRLADGAIGMEYDEQIDAKAGRKGQLQIPEQFTLAIAPFVGEDPYRITARLRYRIREGHLRIGYKLDRPDAVTRDTLNAIADRLSERFTRVYLGEPR
jgi:uncharacterized protein YfdQ (DUF2303 family)